MQIKGIEGIPTDHLKFEIEQGARFVVYQYCLSALVVTLKRSSDIYFVRAGESRVARGIPWALLTLVCGWWGIPWGPIYTVQSLWVDLRGGKDLTSEVMLQMDIGYVDLAATTAG